VGKKTIIIIKSIYTWHLKAKNSLGANDTRLQKKPIDTVIIVTHNNDNNDNVRQGRLTAE